MRMASRQQGQTAGTEEAIEATGEESSTESGVVRRTPAASGGGGATSRAGRRGRRGRQPPGRKAPKADNRGRKKASGAEARRHKSKPRRDAQPGAERRNSLRPVMALKKHLVRPGRNIGSASTILRSGCGTPGSHPTTTSAPRYAISAVLPPSPCLRGGRGVAEAGGNLKFHDVPSGIDHASSRHLHPPRRSCGIDCDLACVKKEQNKRSILPRSQKLQRRSAPRSSSSIKEVRQWSSECRTTSGRPAANSIELL